MNLLKTIGFVIIGLLALYMCKALSNVSDVHAVGLQRPGNNHCVFGQTDCIEIENRVELQSGTFGDVLWTDAHPSVRDAGRQSS